MRKRFPTETSYQGSLPSLTQYQAESVAAAIMLDTEGFEQLDINDEIVGTYVLPSGGRVRIRVHIRVTPGRSMDMQMVADDVAAADLEDVSRLTARIAAAVPLYAWAMAQWLQSREVA